MRCFVCSCQGTSSICTTDTVVFTIPKDCRVEDLFSHFQPKFVVKFGVWVSLTYDFGWVAISSWWFQPIWKIFVKLDHFPKDPGENKKCLKPPPRYPCYWWLLLAFPFHPLDKILWYLFDGLKGGPNTHILWDKNWMTFLGGILEKYKVASSPFPI